MTRLVYGKSRAEKVTWPDRVDPLYELEYQDFIQQKWTTEKLLKQELRVTDAGVVRPLVNEQSVVMRRPANVTHSGRAIMIVAALSEFNHLTTAQIATLLDVHIGYVTTTLEELVISGVVLRLDMGREFQRDKGFGDVWRLNRSADNPHISRWAARLKPVEWMLISNGVDMDTISGSNHPFAIQHNIMTNELLIRAMESNPAIIGAWGERHARMVDMYQNVRFPEDVSRKNIADGILVTRSGKIIVIEASGSSLVNKKGGDNKNALVKKAAAWVAACAYSELDIRVVFVDISAKPDVSRLELYVGIGVEKESAAYVTRRRYRQKGAEKIYVADGRRWFPSARSVSDDFLWMLAHNTANNRNEHIIDEDDFISNPDADIVRNTLAALHVPSWIKNMPDLKIA